MSEKKALAERIRQARGTRTQLGFAEAAQLNVNTLRGYETGRNAPGADMILSIAAAAGVRPEWLLTGKLPMRGESDRGSLISATKTSDIGSQKAQPIENVEPAEGKLSDAGHFERTIQAQRDELLTLYRENNQLVREIADLRAENSRLHSQLAAAVGALEKSTAGVTSANAVGKAG